MTVGQSSFSAAASGGAISSRGAAYCGLPPGVASAARLFEAAVCGERGVSARPNFLCQAWFRLFRPSGPVGVPCGTLFLEATQRKTVCTAAVALCSDPDDAEVQEADIGTCNCRRPTVPVDADVMQFSAGIDTSPSAVAEARGRAALSLPGGNATENRTHG